MRTVNLKKIPAIFAGCSAAVLLAACGGSGSGSSGGDADGGTGTMNLSVTDAPIDGASSVIVEFSGVSLKPAEGEAIEFTFDEVKSIDLLSLQGSASEGLLTGQELDAGEYEWIRLHVNAEEDGVMDSYIELETGNQHELRVPSGSQTGLKLVSGFTVLAGSTVDFTIDFDLRKSIVAPPSQASIGYMLKPALRLIDNAEAGSIAGTVAETTLSSACVDASTEAGSVYVYSDADVTPTDVSGAETDPLTTAMVSFEEDAYRYEVGFLAPGSYTVTYTCDAAMDDPEAVDTLTFVGTGNVTVEADVETPYDITGTVETSSGGDETTGEEVAQ